ncbi:helix-turn-helix domain-containing protein [Enterococcus sp. DIV0800]|uniref:helix-turn-helix domain-containing protein n=1 Tax=unclassified Enterococcus TaxID=2608891 RepID=UPI003D301123
MNRLKEERIKKGVTQKQVAESVKLSLSMIQKIEGGHKKAGDDTKKRLAKYYKRTVGYLFYNE